MTDEVTPQSEFEQDLQTQTAAEFSTADIPLTMGGKRYTIRIRQHGSIEWADATDRHPIRANVDIDRRFGYNLRSLTIEACQTHGTLLNKDGAAVVVSKAQWEELLRGVDGGTYNRLGDAIFSLNEVQASEVANSFSKALGVVLGSSMNSRATPESPLDGSKDGNPAGD